MPIGNGAMPDRSFIEWDKDDIDALGILKVDVLALGMLTCIRKCLDLLQDHHGRRLTLASVPQRGSGNLCHAAQGRFAGRVPGGKPGADEHAAAPAPAQFYDLVIQVAIVRPGPIQGDMVHPYLKRRRGAEEVEIPAPAPGAWPAGRA